MTTEGTEYSGFFFVILQLRVVVIYLRVLLFDTTSNSQMRTSALRSIPTLSDSVLAVAASTSFGRITMPAGCVTVSKYALVTARKDETARETSDHELQHVHR
jgi:hypothetical protein